MHKSVLFLLAACAAGTAAAQEGRRDPRDPKTMVPRVEYRSPLEGYRRFAADQEPADWRKANEEVGTAGGHAGHKPAQQAPGRETSKPQPGGGK